LIWRLHRTLEINQWLPSEQVEEFQNRQLRRILDHAYSNVPYYQEMFSRLGLSPRNVHGIQDLQCLPLLTKEAVRNSGDSLRARNSHQFGALACRTSGSSGEPLTFYVDKYSNALEFAYYWRHWSWGGYRIGARFAELSGHFFVVRPQMADITCHYQPHINRLVLNSNQVSVPGCRKMAATLRKYRPRFLKGMPSTLYFLAHSLEEAGIKDLSFQCVFSTGEVLTSSYRSVIERVFHTRVLDSYGHMERTVAVAQCPQGGYHVNSDYGIMETAAAPGNANGGATLRRVIGTGLHNRAMPLIRYDVGDHIELFSDERSCPCGRTLPLIRVIHGRCEDAILTPDGRFITTLFIVPEFVSGTRFVQFVQEVEDGLQIRVVPGPEWSESSAATLIEYTSRMTGHDTNISVKVISEADLIRDQSGKLRCVIGLRSLSARNPAGGLPV
jgi:phenylacetate-CoA ligase